MEDRHPYTIYNEALEVSIKKHGTIPHCDSLVLHKPSTCEYCDERPELHEVRQKYNIAYTGEHDSNKIPCPAEVRRPQELIERWHGNIPMTKDDIAEQDKHWEEMREQFDGE